MAKKLEINDILDMRAYERDRKATVARMITTKQARRVTVGGFITLVFENRDTVWFQIQEMARVEKLIRDEQIQDELDAYNPLIPDPGELSATLFLELTSDAEMREWLPKLVGIEKAVRVRLGEGADAVSVAFRPDQVHAEQLTREEVTAAVHYVKATLTPEQVERFAAGPVTLVIDHPAFQQETPLPAATQAALLQDLRG